MLKKKKRWIAFTGCIALFMALALNLERLEAIDSAAYGVIARLHGGTATAFFTGMTNLVHPLVLVLLSAGVMLAMRRRVYIVPTCANLAISVLLNLGLKSVFTRVRPEAVVQFGTHTGYSFPSGHAMAACAYYGFFIYLVHHCALRKGTKTALTAFLTTVIALVGVSRIYLGAHYFTDVVGGISAASAYLIVYTGFIGRYFCEGARVADGRTGGSNTVFSSFAHAIDGVFEGLKAERNMVIHFGAATLTVVFGAILRINVQEWIACALCIGLVMAAELINTAIETTVDICCPEYSEKARRAKDTAAGAVLIAAGIAAIVGLLIFAPKIAAVALRELK